MQTNSSKYFGYNLDLLFEALSSETHLLVAVSGGSDSLAMMYLLNDWSTTCPGPKLTVATIDHGLRRESADEARYVGSLARNLGLRHIVRKWQGAKPRSALSEKSRETRYAMLAEIAASIGATAIVLGHNRDDQRETIMMRAERLGFDGFDEAPDDTINHGLAGIRPVVFYLGPPGFEQITLHRPVLSVARAKLQLFLERMGVNWIDDPSNEDDRYERIRWRKKLAAHPTKYPTAYQIEKFADNVAIHRQRLAERCAEAITENVRCDQSGVLLMRRQAVEKISEQTLILLIRVLVAVAGGRKYFVSKDKAKNLVTALTSTGRDRHTLGSAVIERDHETVRIWRENRNLPEVGVTNETALSCPWDGRIVYHFSRHHLLQPLVMGALGLAGVQHVEKSMGRHLTGASRRALRSQPALFLNGRPVHAPMAGWSTPGFDRPEVVLWSPALEMFLPHCDFTLFEAISAIRTSAFHCSPADCS